MDPNKLACFWAARDDQAFLLKLHVQPRASKTKLCGLHGEALKISITAPPVDGKANKEIITFFAKLFHLPRTSVTVKSGQQSRTKMLRFEQFPVEQARQIIAGILAGR